MANFCHRIGAGLSTIQREVFDGPGPHLGPLPACDRAAFPCWPLKIGAIHWKCKRPLKYIILTLNMKRDDAEILEKNRPPLRKATKSYSNHYLTGLQGKDHRCIPQRLQLLLGRSPLRWELPRRHFVGAPWFHRRMTWSRGSITPTRSTRSPLYQKMLLTSSFFHY